MLRNWKLCLTLLGLVEVMSVGCGAPVEPSQANLTLWDESGRELTALPIVARLHLGGAYAISTDDVLLIRGLPSSRTLSLVRAGEVPETAAKARVPLAVWTEGSELILAPTQLLDEDQEYAVLALGVGLIASPKTKAGAGEPIYVGVGRLAVRPSEQVAYCLEEALDSTAEYQALSPAGVEFGLGQMFKADSRCFRLQAPPQQKGFFVPPATVAGVAVSPEPVLILDLDETNGVFAVSDTSDASADVRDEHCFSFGCFLSERAGLLLSFERGSYAVELQGSDGAELFLVEVEDTPILLGPVSPMQDLTIIARPLSPLGETESLSFSSGPAEARFVLTEVLANPRGPEPEAEWVEIVNVGTAPGDLEGYRLVDEGGETLLPSVSLEPQQSGLIVRRDYVVDRDVVPDAQAVPIFVDAIGRDGLRNSGERLKLLDAQGRAVSQVVSRSCPEGRSLARIDPWAADREESFVVHGGNGASPGAPNVVDEGG